MLRSVRARSPDAELWSDASGPWGCGAFWSSLWFQVKWVQSQPITESSIAAQKFLPILLAGRLVGEMWSGCTVRCNFDNHAGSGLHHQPAVCPGSTVGSYAHMLRCLFLICALLPDQFDLVAEHTPGLENIAISRDNLAIFRSQDPYAARSPTPIPPLCLCSSPTSR